MVDMTNKAQRWRKQWRRRAKVIAGLPTDPHALDRLSRAARREARKGRRRVTYAASAARRRLTGGIEGAGPGAATVDLPTVRIPEGPVAHPEVRAAVILDSFSEMALRYEWDQVLVTPENWRETLSAQRPDLLFVESAWRGNNGAWKYAMTSPGAPVPALRELVAWCREQGIPTVFWNKEDPPNYDRFIETAKLFDQVFTVDADRIPAYREDLGHDRVALLPFGAQPRIHNPIRHDHNGAERPHGVAFAGTYFAEKHPERREQMSYVLDPARDHDLHIFSRMQTGDTRYRFPARYQSHIVGSLPYDRMLAAYTAYKVFLNVNSVTQSPTMCARRLFELSAAQTAVVSAPAASIQPFFGDDLTVVHDAEETEQRLGNLLKQDQLRDRVALRAHRRVFDEHLYGDRIATVLGSVGVQAAPVDQSISAVVPTMRPDQLENVWQFIHRQHHSPVELVLVTHGFTPDEGQVAALNERYPLDGLTILPADRSLNLGVLMNMGVEASSGRYVAKMDDDNYYAAHYLSDLVPSFSWTDAQVVGKWAHYVHIGGDDGPTLLRFAASEHRYVRLVQGGTILTPRDVALQYRFEDLPRRVDTTFLDKIRADGGRVYSSDRFNYVSTRTADASGHTWGVSTEHLLAHSSELVFYGPAESHVTV